MFIAILLQVSKYSLLLPIFFGIKGFKTLQKYQKVVLGYLVFSFFIEIIAHYLIKKYGNNLPLLHLYSVIEYNMLAIPYFLYFRKDKWVQKIIVGLSIILIPIAIADAFYLNGLYKHNTYFLPSASILMVTYSFLYFFAYFKELNPTNIWKQNMFWFSTANLVFFSLSFFLNAMMNYFLDTDMELAILTKRMFWVINIVFHCLLIGAFKK